MEGKQMNGVNITNYRNIAHLALKGAHLSKYSGVFDCPGKPLHGRKFFQESETEMDNYEPGKTTSIFYLNDEPKTFVTLKGLIKHYNKEKRKRRSLSNIVYDICKESGVSFNKIRAKDRHADIVEIRQFLHYFAQAERGITQKAAGIMFNCDHATARYSRIQFTNRFRTDKIYRKKITELCQKVGITIALTVK